MRLETTRALLLKKWQSLLLRRPTEALADEAERLAGPEPGRTDVAAGQTAVRVLDELSEPERAQLAKVVNALERIKDGTYGRCISCNRSVSSQRLRVLPEADRCDSCAKTCN